MTTEYGVFIIESLKFENEKSNDLDGKVLKQILDLCKIKNEYYYIRTKKELRSVIHLFEISNLRYLHFSCHGSPDSLQLTLDSLPFSEFANIIKPYIKNHRLFLSACHSANRELAEELIANCQCYSLIGSPVEIYFDQSAVFWSAFYQRMKRINKEMMTKKDLSTLLEKLSNTFELDINYFSFIRSNRTFDVTKMKEYLIRPNTKPHIKTVPF